jgi:hypothetical protein
VNPCRLLHSAMLLTALIFCAAFFCMPLSFTPLPGIPNFLPSLCICGAALVCFLLLDRLDTKFCLPHAEPHYLIREDI